MKATLLYISNDQFSLAAVRVLLVSRGYHVLLARTCPYALQLLESTHFDAIVLDSDMGDHITREMTMAIKNHASDTRLLLLASHRYSEVRTASCDAFCSKLDGNEAFLFQLARLLTRSPEPQVTQEIAVTRHPLRDTLESIGSPKRLLEAS